MTSPLKKTTKNVATKPTTTRPAGTGIRINKRIADLGIASRREADVLIEKGLVFVNGVKAGIGQVVSTTDVVTVGALPGKKNYIAYYKGRGVITHSPTNTEVDIVTKLKKDYGITGLSPVGRLDKDSEGLIILANDGRITGPLLDPENSHEKEYSVTVDKKVTPAFCRLLELGVDIEGYKTKPATVAPSTKNEKRFNITITEGKKHQIRRMCAALGYQVESLKRVRIMNITLGALKPNQYRKISGEELTEFLSALGITQ